MMHDSINHDYEKSTRLFAFLDTLVRRIVNYKQLFTENLPTHTTISNTYFLA